MPISFTKWVNQNQIKKWSAWALSLKISKKCQGTSRPTLNKIEYHGLISTKFNFKKSLDGFKKENYNDKWNFSILIT